MVICNAQLIDSTIPSVTGKRYPVDILHRIAKNKVVYGELSPVGDRFDLNVEDCSHKVVNLDVRNGVLYGDVQVLKTPMGELLSLYGQYKSTKIEFRPRGTGQIDEKTMTVTDYNIIALDCYMEDTND